MKFFLIGLVLFLLNGCGSIYQISPIGIDEHEEALKKSPCACLEVKTIRDLPDFVFYDTDDV